MQRFDRQKTKALVLHALASAQPDGLSAAGLSIVMFVADVIHLARAGLTVTGGTYIRDRSGAASRHLATVRTELLSDGVIEEFSQETESGARSFVRIVAARSGRKRGVASMNLDRDVGSLNAREMAAVGMAIEWFHGVEGLDRVAGIDPLGAIEGVATIGEPIDLSTALL